eukprot:2884082-Rhodomonas_salina.2
MLRTGAESCTRAIAVPHAAEHACVLADTIRYRGTGHRIAARRKIRHLGSLSGGFARAPP